MPTGRNSPRPHRRGTVWMKPQQRQHHMAEGKQRWPWRHVAGERGPVVRRRRTCRGMLLLKPPLSGRLLPLSGARRLAVHWCWSFACNPEGTNWPPRPARRVHPPSLPPPPSERREREVSCPACDRRLRVPVSYAGTIGCPDCGHKFAVEASAAPPSTISASQQEADEVEVVNEQPEPLPAKIEIGCPKCSQTLRIPRSYEGSVRCPACTHVFKAQDGTSAS